MGGGGVKNEPLEDRPGKDSLAFAKKEVWGRKDTKGAVWGRTNPLRAFWGRSNP